MSDVASSAPQASAYYDASYFAWQRQMGEFVAWSNLDKYRNTVGPNDRVLDFGCGGGFLLAKLDCAERIGVEPNSAARESAAANGAKAFASSAEALAALGPECVDVIISDNAIEHALEPWRELCALKPLLKRGGRFHFVAPCENIGWRFKDDDVNQHLYSWSPQSFGNLFKAAGYDVETARPYIHKIPPRIGRPLAKLGRPVFNAACRMWGQIDRRWYQVEAIGRRPMEENG